MQTQEIGAITASNKSVRGVIWKKTDQPWLISWNIHPSPDNLEAFLSVQILCDHLQSYQIPIHIQTAFQNILHKIPNDYRLQSCGITFRKWAPSSACSISNSQQFMDRPGQRVGLFFPSEVKVQFTVAYWQAGGTDIWTLLLWKFSIKSTCIR